ncbi:uncharacterized protein C1orf127 homolog [Echinops telfairi]|uniref:Uncharacterized protein C1orf127 homolog n=1 Tax=Echinops telfairi TaxID=9371 RepID=A0AC55DTR4_ECHTE|nr:uncharacterized protein C1orf127 homolog [Echinops telfairi]
MAPTPLPPSRSAGRGRPGPTAPSSAGAQTAAPDGGTNPSAPLRLTYRAAARKLEQETRSEGLESSQLPPRSNKMALGPPPPPRRPPASPITSPPRGGGRLADAPPPSRQRSGPPLRRRRLRTRRGSSGKTYTWRRKVQGGKSVVASASLTTHGAAACLAWALSVAFTRMLPLKPNRDRPSPVLEDSTGEVECFSDYMTLWLPRRHAEGLRQWLGRELQLPGPWRSAPHLDPLLAQCGYFLHPTPDGDFLFRALYSACFVQKEKANYRLEIRVFQKGVSGPERSDGYIMECPVRTPKLDQVYVRCGPEFIQVSRPLPLGSSSGQGPWLLSLRGELVASLEDASLIGLDVDTNATTITVQSPRSELLQRREVLNTSTELLLLWLVGGHSAYSLEATCPPVSSQPQLDVFVHIPKQRLGLVKRGPYIEESLTLRSLRVLQSSTFRVTESPDLVVASIPAAGLLQVQPCQEDQGAPGTQAFSRVDLSLVFAEAATPALWTAENFFQCVGSGTELPTSAATPRTAPSPQPPGPESLPVGMASAASSPLQTARFLQKDQLPREEGTWTTSADSQDCGNKVDTHCLRLPQAIMWDEGGSFREFLENWNEKMVDHWMVTNNSNQ